MDSRGGITGGLTIADALREYEARGYEGQFLLGAGGTLECCYCHKQATADQFRLDSLRRIEGVSDPADMNAVAALQCPACGMRGTATLVYGANAPSEDGDALRLLEDQRPSHQIHVKEDDSLVYDSGWIDRGGAGRLRPDSG